MSATADATRALTHLERANKIRITRSRMKAHVHALPRSEGRLVVAALLLTTPGWLHAARIGDVLAWPARTYRTDLEAWLAAAGDVSELARVAGPYQRRNSNQQPGVLTERQRLVLAECLRGDR